MIAIIANESFLLRSEFEAGLPKYIDSNEKWKIYDNLEEALADKDEIEIIINSRFIKPEIIKEFTNLKWIYSYSAGVDTYPLSTLEEMGVVLTNTSGVHAKNIAEQVLGAMILFSRNFLDAMANQRKKVWDQEIVTKELYKQRLLIVGAGSIGKEIGRKAKAFDMEVVGIRSRKVDEKLENFDEVYSIADLDTELAKADYVVAVMPSTEQTRGLFDKSKFEQMSEDAIFINVGRGDLIVEDDLYEALANKTIKGAYLDVFPVEPLPEESKLWDLDNLVITPHNAGPTPHYFDRAMEIFAENLKRSRQGQDLINVIDYQKSY